MKYLIKPYTLATLLLLGMSVFTDASADVYKCVTGGRVTYSTLASDCAIADTKTTLARVPVDKYPLDVGVRKGKMGDAAHAYLRGMSTTIPHYSNAEDNADMPELVVPDLSRPEYSGSN